MAGRFENGIGAFYANDTLAGKPIRVRFHWTLPQPDSPRRERAFSADAGATWETSQVMDFSRQADSPFSPELRILGATIEAEGSMATKLEKPLKREIVLNDAPYMLTISPDGLKLVPKGKRNGLELTWKGILMQATMSEAAGGSSGS